MRCCQWVAGITGHIPVPLVALYAMTFFLILPLVCINMSHSLYHVKGRKDMERTRLLNENEQRLGDALPIIANYNESVHQSKKALPRLYSSSMDVALTVITVSRKRHAVSGKSPRYLTQVVGRLLELINTTSLNSHKRYGIFLCNVDGEPEAYEEFRPLKELLPTFQRVPKKRSTKQSIFEKEKQDYVFCLEETLKRNVSYAFLVEDDGYPHYDLIPVLEHVIDSRLDHRLHREGLVKKRRVTYVKFYHPERLLTYFSFEPERIPELIAISFVFGTLGCLVFFSLNPPGKRTNIVWMLFVVYFCLLAISIGRVNLLELRRLSTRLYQLTPAAGCCTPAMLFTREGGTNVAQQLKGVTCRLRYGKDMALEDIRSQQGYTALMVQPNVFKHIGMVSSLRGSLLDPFIV